MLDSAGRSSSRSLHLGFCMFWSFCRELILEFLVEISTCVRRKKNKSPWFCSVNLLAI